MGWYSIRLNGVEVFTLFVVTLEDLAANTPINHTAHPIDAPS